MPIVPQFSDLDRLRGIAREMRRVSREPTIPDPSGVNRSAVKIYPDMQTEATLRQLASPHWRRVLEED
jgi:hypothetical protein